MRATSLLSALAAALIGLAPARAAPLPEVDVAIVLAVDISYSMDPDELTLQRDGYVQALNSPEVLDAIRKGALGRIAVTYVEWAGFGQQQQLVDWTLVDGPAAARQLGDRLAEAPIRRAARTSISSALLYSMALIESSGIRAERRVIDISGDGPNNQGPLILDARERVLARGIAINGLPILLRRDSFFDIDNLDDYYRQCVIGGPGAFVIPINDRKGFADAIRQKLIIEISAIEPRRFMMPTQARGPVDCQVGEKQWQQRYGGRDFQ